MMQAKELFVLNNAGFQKKDGKSAHLRGSIYKILHYTVYVGQVQHI